MIKTTHEYAEKMQGGEKQWVIPIDVKKSLICQQLLRGG
jgi:hypothetical protein